MVLPLAPRLRMQVHGKRAALPAVMMRAGTSKGLFIHRHNLPASELEWAPILLSAMGSRNASQRQIDGVGGATSTTSKIAVVAKSLRPGIDVDYTFVQVAVGESKIDMSGTCGNMASGVAPFAVDEKLIAVASGQKAVGVMVYNTNTDRSFRATIQMDDEGRFDEDGEFAISGVPGTGSRIVLSFIQPAGSMTGKLLPTGHPQDIIPVPSTPSFPSFSIRASLVDAANPFIFVDADGMPAIYNQLGPDHLISLEIIESIRRQGAVLYGLAFSVQTAALVRGTPKIALVSRPHRVEPGSESKMQPVDVEVVAYSMGKMHPTLQLTGAVCLSAAARVPGSVVAEAVAAGMATVTPSPRSPKELEVLVEQVKEVENMRRTELVLRHPSGIMTTDAETSVDASGKVTIESVSVYRTASKLFEGNVFYTP